MVSSRCHTHFWIAGELQSAQETFGVAWIATVFQRNRRMLTPCTARQQNLNLTSEEKRVYYQLFQAADTTNLGVITGEIAVPFFEKTKLSPETLGLVCRAPNVLQGLTFTRIVRSNASSFQQR
ncbi:hypothetical protein BJX63DRAFT_397470 [Aspergillus granulosus]|uniref:Uncharacterized protein n=1 Tax=Aspergillus granulosus TaxID=176169 RepID=A0ABR4H9G7_9EURO